MGRMMQTKCQDTLWGLEAAYRQYFNAKLANQDEFNYLCNVIDSSRARSVLNTNPTPAGRIDEEYFTARPAPDPLKLVQSEIEVVDR